MNCFSCVIASVETAEHIIRKQGSDFYVNLQIITPAHKFRLAATKLAI